jgi:MazG family protein
MEKYPPEADSLLAVLRRLRAPDGCPWDREQTRHSLVRHLEGECAELIYAIDKDDSANICEELGDVLMNLLFQVVVAEEKGEFTMEDVWRQIIDKMIRRHAHVFGNESASNAEEVAALWQKIKAQEHAGIEENKSVLDKVKPCLSPLERAEKLQKKAAETGFDWLQPLDITDKIAEETEEVRSALASGDEDAVDEELGDLLFAVINLIRFRKRANASELLRKANMKFERRFRAMEERLSADGIELEKSDAQTFDRYWEEVKSAEKGC